MVFNSLTYLVFLCGVVALYWSLPRRPRLWLIFLASLTFYGFWRVEFLPLMLLSAFTDYAVSLAIARSDSLRYRKTMLALSLVVNLGMLFIFKYLIFFAESAYGLTDLLGFDIEMSAMKIILPLGISFYTFQTISYTVDVYRGFIKPERDFILYASYVVFFPQLVAGPILRAREVLPQLDCRPEAKISDLVFGIRRILYGLFVKVVLADNIASIVNSGFAMPTDLLGALDVWTLAFLFGFQIYFDFCGYSHIAIGSARLMGIQFPENFNFPYLARSPKDFWQRWHISLSSWVRDYLYLPLAAEKVNDRSTGGLARVVELQSRSVSSVRKRNIALLATWAIMGLWHGAAWTFVLWGIYHAIFILLYRVVQSRMPKLPGLISEWAPRCVTLPIIMLGWIFFRADLAQSFLMYGKILSPSEYGAMQMRPDTYLVTALLLAGILITYYVKTRLMSLLERLVWLKFSLDAVVIAVMVFTVFVFLRPINQFIYFQF